MRLQLLSALVIFLTFGTVLLSFRPVPGLPGCSVWQCMRYAAIRKTDTATTEDALILRRGTKWGLALGSCMGM